MTPIILSTYAVVAILIIFAMRIYYKNATEQGRESWRKYYGEREREAHNKLTETEATLTAVKAELAAVKSEMQSAKIKLAVENERGKMLESELQQAYDLIEKYRIQAGEALELVQKWAEVQNNNEPASKFVEVAKVEPEPEPELKAFPEGYVIPKGTRVVAIANSTEYSKFAVEIGCHGTVVEPFTSRAAIVIFDGKNDNDGCGYCLYNHDLAPLDPRDHPEHPEFRKP